MSNQNLDDAPVVLLLDDGFRERPDGKPESFLQSFAERLETRERLRCVAPPLTDDRGFSNTSSSVEDISDLMLSLIRKHSALAVVLDASWWNDDLFAMKVWKVAIDSNRLTIPTSRLVIVSRHLNDQQKAEYVNELGLDPRQVLTRLSGNGGLDDAANWLKAELG